VVAHALSSSANDSSAAVARFESKFDCAPLMALGLGFIVMLRIGMAA
jgi:hypothetical protein